VLRLLPELSKKDREEVRKRLVFLGTRSAPVEEQQVEADDWLLLGFTEELRRRGLVTPRFHFLPKMVPTSYPAKSADVRKYLLSGYSQAHPPRAELLALGRLAAHVLCSFLKKIKVPVGPKTVLEHTHQVPAAFEESFPGYWRSRALGVIIGQINRNA